MYHVFLKNGSHILKNRSKSLIALIGLMKFGLFAHFPRHSGAARRAEPGNHNPRPESLARSR
jgi:hypothetical protein